MRLFGISRPTVREALRVLESESLIWVQRGGHGGARVRAPDPGVVAGYAGALLQYNATTIDDVFDARIAVEVAAVRMVALRRPARRLRAVEDSLDAEAAANDPSHFRPCATATHTAIVRAAGNQTMNLFFDLTVEIYDRHARVGYEKQTPDAEREKDFRASHALHRKVFEHMRDGRADEAETLWRRHLGRNRSAMLTGRPERVLDLFRD